MGPEHGAGELCNDAPCLLKLFDRHILYPMRFWCVYDPAFVHVSIPAERRGVGREAGETTTIPCHERKPPRPSQKPSARETMRHVRPLTHEFDGLVVRLEWGASERLVRRNSTRH